MRYTYNPAKIKEHGKDQMRFELGDTCVDGGGDTCALSDEEYCGVLRDLPRPLSKRSWLRMKLRCLEAIMFKLSYQTDTKIDVLSYGLGKRAEHWQKLYRQVRGDVTVNAGAPSVDAGTIRNTPYFAAGMEENKRALHPNAAGILT
jgi:hypothetical protein